MMWDHDRSSARGLMACEGLDVFTHESRVGNAPAHKLFARIRVERRDGVETPRSFKDYKLEVDDRDLPAGVTLSRLVE